VSERLAAVVATVFRLQPVRSEEDQLREQPV